MNKIRSIIIIILILFINMVSHAVAIETSIETSKTKKIDKDESQTIKKSKEQKDSTGTKKSKTTSKGIDKHTQATIRNIIQAQKSESIDITLPLQAVFLDRIAELETTEEPFKTCKIVTSPKVPRDFGISSEMRAGGFDINKGNMLNQAVQSNSPLTSVTSRYGEKEVRKYRDCLALYGSIIGQAYLFLNDDIRDIGAQVVKEKEDNFKVRGIGLADFEILTHGVLRKASKKIKNSMILRLFSRIMNDTEICRFDKTVQEIKCGASLMTLGTVPQLYISGIKYYGDSFAGFTGTYKVVANWSHSDAVDKLKTTSKYSKFAEQVSKYADSLVLKGKSKEAVMVKKKAFELAKSGKQTVSPSRLLPGN